MRITGVAVTNFKALRDVDVSIDLPLAAIVGRNNSGKSALLDAVWIARESVRDPQVNPDPSLGPRGGWNEIVFSKRPTDDPIKIRLRMRGKRTDFGVTPTQNLSPDALPTDLICTYELGLRPNAVSERRVHFDFGKQGTADFPYTGPGGVTTQGNVQFDPSAFVEGVARVGFLAADRIVQQEIEAAGGATLNADGSNLIQVLNDRASSSPQVFNAIIQTAQRIIPELEEFLAGLQPGTNIASGSAREKAFGNTEFRWPHLSSGTRQVILLSAFLNTARPGSLLLIEEPELYLHTESVWRLLEAFSEHADQQQKQFLFTTHSSAVIERLGFKATLLAARDVSTGEARVESLAEFSSLDSFLAKNGFMTHELLLPSSGIRPLASLLLIVEGPDDEALWPKFMTHAKLPADKVRVVRPRNGGWAEAGKAAALFKKLDAFGLPAVPSLLIVEADDDPQSKAAKLKEYGLSPDDYCVLPLDLEAYLLDRRALAAVLAKSLENVDRAIRKAGGRPRKEKFEQVLRFLDANPNQKIKRRLAAALPRLPRDIRAITNLIRERTYDSS